MTVFIPVILQTIEMTCVKISFKDQQILNIWCPYVPPEKPKLMEELCNHINRKMSEKKKGGMKF
jgi:hypothetical protein